MEAKLDREKVEREAKEILDKFAKALEKVDAISAKAEDCRESKDEESYVDRDEFERTERASSDFSKSEDSRIPAKADHNKTGSSDKSNEDFREKMLANAPNHDEDFIIAERGGWK